MSFGFYKESKYNAPVTYAVKHPDLKIRMESRSGGFFTALSDLVLHDQGVIYGCILDEDFNAVHIRTENTEARDQMRGSKYIQSSMGDMFLRVREDLYSGRLVLFSGTSCQVAGLNTFLGKDYENLLLLDIVCHGVPSPAVWQSYIHWNENKAESNLIGVDFRNKNHYGWAAHYETLYMKNGKQINSQLFKKLFYGHYILRPGCYHCPYKDIIHPGNITIGDYWGVDRAAPGFNDNKGVNLVMINDEKGKIFFEKIKDQLICVKTDIQDSIQPPLQAPYPEPTNREAFWHMYETKSFESVLKKYAGYGDWNWIKRFVKRAVKKVL